METDGRSIRPVRIALASLVGLAVIWHALPLVVWYAYVQPQLAGEPNAHRLRVPHTKVFEAPDVGWTRHTYADVELIAPFVDSDSTGCEDATDLCQRTIAGGRLSISRSPPGETHAQMLNLRAPDERDLSPMRSASQNWATIRALRDRVTTSRARLESWRYAAAGSRGIVAETDRAGQVRYVVVAYPSHGGEARMIGIVGSDRSLVLRIIGSIRL